MVEVIRLRLNMKRSQMEDHTVKMKDYWIRASRQSFKKVIHPIS